VKNHIFFGEKSPLQYRVSGFTLSVKTGFDPVLFYNPKKLLCMSDSRWWTAKQEIAAFKAYIDGLPSDTPRAYTLTKDQIDTLLNQKAGGLDGIRMYFGAKTVEGVVIPTLSIVATELVSGVLHDYGVPPVIEPPALARVASPSGLSAMKAAPIASLEGEGDPGGGGGGEEEEEEVDSLGDPEPCPSMCGPDNALNSEEP
jgi:hypothetical protein